VDQDAEVRRLVDKLRDDGQVKYGSAAVWEKFGVPDDVPVVVVDNVADYFYRGTRQEIWRLDRDFPNVAPPWQQWWMEHRAPGVIESEVHGTTPYQGPSMVGSYFTAIKLDEHEGVGPDAKWAVGVTSYMEYNRELQQVPWTTVYQVAGDGSMIADPNHPDGVDGGPALKYVPAGVDAATWHRLSARGPNGEPSSVQATGLHLLYVPLLALTFFHCKNVELVEGTMPPRLRKKHEKRGRTVSGFHTLKISPMVRRVEHEERSHGVGTAKALHIVHGHFKDYRERGLFGQHKGLFWWEQHVRGDEDLGVVDKRYEVEAPTTEGGVR
jgi:hypothetical protein